MKKKTSEESWRYQKPLCTMCIAHQKIQDNIRSYDIWWHPKPLQTDLLMERQRDKRISGARQILKLHIRPVGGLHPLPFADRICRVVFDGPQMPSSKIDTTYLGMNYRRKKQGKIYLTHHKCQNAKHCPFWNIPFWKYVRSEYCMPLKSRGKY